MFKLLSKIISKTETTNKYNNTETALNEEKSQYLIQILQLFMAKKMSEPIISIPKMLISLNEKELVNVLKIKFSNSNFEINEFEVYNCYELYLIIMKVIETSDPIFSDEICKLLGQHNAANETDDLLKLKFSYLKDYHKYLLGSLLYVLDLIIVYDFTSCEILASKLASVLVWIYPPQSSDNLYAFSKLGTLIITNILI